MTIVRESWWPCPCALPSLVDARLLIHNTPRCTFLPSDLWSQHAAISKDSPEDRRSQFQQVFAASSQKSWDPCIRPWIQPESRRSELAKQSWEFDVWHQFQPHPERRELARSCCWALSSTRAWKAVFCWAVFKAWNLAMISTKLGGSDFPKWPSELDFWLQVQPETGRSELAKWASDLVTSHTKPFKNWTCQEDFRAWHSTLELHTCTCWKERCQMICRNWLSTVMSFRHLNTWACQMVQRLEFLLWFHWKAGRSVLALGSSELDIWMWKCHSGVGRSEMANGSSELDVWLQVQPEHARSSFAKWSSNLEIQPLFWQDLWGSELAKQSSEFDLRWWFRQYARHDL